MKHFILLLSTLAMPTFLYAGVVTGGMGKKNPVHIVSPEVMRELEQNLFSNNEIYLNSFNEKVKVIGETNVEFDNQMRQGVIILNRKNEFRIILPSY